MKRTTFPLPNTALTESFLACWMFVTRWEDGSSFTSSKEFNTSYLKVEIDGLQIPKGRLVENPYNTQYLGTVPCTFQFCIWSDFYMIRVFSGKAIWTLVNLRVGTSWGICISLHLFFNSASLNRVNHQRLEKHRSAFFGRKHLVCGRFEDTIHWYRSGHDPPQKSRTLSIQSQFHHKAGPNIKACLSGVNSSTSSNIRT